MKPYKTQAFIQSLNVGLMKPTHKDEITVLEKVGDNDYIVEYKACAVTVFLIGSSVNTLPTTFTGGLRNERQRNLGTDQSKRTEKF